MTHSGGFGPASYGQSISEAAKEHMRVPSTARVFDRIEVL
jgi:hypothetical protein